MATSQTAAPPPAQPAPLSTQTQSHDHDHDHDFEDHQVDYHTLSPIEKTELAENHSGNTYYLTDDNAAAAAAAAAAPLEQHTTFTPQKSLHINTQGIPLLRLPVPPKDLETTVHHFDGELAYTSTRANKRSGDCVLADSKGVPLIETTYHFGPGRDPSLVFLEGSMVKSKGEIKTSSKWTSRGHEFTLPDGGKKLLWTYKKEHGFGNQGKKGEGLVLEAGGRRLAVLVRNEESRSEGSNKRSAGNGGELVLGEGVGKGVGPGGIEEEVVVATCLLMLRKEVDRRMARQKLTMLGAANSA